MGSAKDTQDFNYLNNSSNNQRNRRQRNAQNDDPHFPELGAKEQQQVNGDHNDSKDISNEDDNGYAAEKSWVEHDEVGMDEDEDLEQEQEEQQQQQRGKRQKARPKQIWKAKS